MYTLSTALFLLSSLFLKSHQERLTIETGNFAGLDLFEAENKIYEVTIDITPHTESLLDGPLHQRESRIRVLSKRGQPFSCLLPQQIEPKEEEELELDEILSVDIAGLLAQLRLNCLLTNQGWWTYKYCHGDKITQFHLEGGKVVGRVITLGYFEKEDEWTTEKIQKSLERQKKEKSLKERNVIKLPSHVADYTNGTFCDLNNVQRETTAKIVCSPYHTNIEIVRIFEHETCNYTFIIHAPQLCDHPLFKSDRSTEGSVNVIKCAPILTEEQYDRYMSTSHAKQAKSAVKEAVKEEATKKTKSVPLMDILQSLAASIAERVNSEIGEDDALIDESTEAMIDKLVTESLDSVFSELGGSSKVKQREVKSDEKDSDTDVSKSKSVRMQESESQRDLTTSDSESVIDQRSESVRDQKSESVKDQRRESVRDQRSESVEDQRSESVKDQRSESVRDQTSSESVKDDQSTTENYESDLEDVTDNSADTAREGKGKVRVFHVKLTDEKSLQKEDIDKLVDQMSSEESKLLSEPAKETVKKSKHSVIEIDLSKKSNSEQTASFLAEILEKYLGDSSNEEKTKQTMLEENYSNSWEQISEEKKDEE